MASNTYYATYKRWNGSGWDTIYFRAPAAVIQDGGNQDRNWLTDAEKNLISTYLNSFNAANKLLKLENDGKISWDRMPFDNTTYVKRAGDVMTGDLSMGTKNITFGNGTGISTSGDIGTIGIRADNGLTIDALIHMTGKKITGLGNPTSNTDATTKQYVDQLVSTGTRAVEAVKVATTENVTLSGLGSIDLYQLVANDRILVKNQSTSSQNGIYVAKSGSWTKVTEDSGIGALVFVEHGLVNNDSMWFVKNENEWTKYSQVDVFQFGSGLSKTGNIVSLDENSITNSYIASNAAIGIHKIGVGATSINDAYFFTSMNDSKPDLAEQLTYLFSSIRRLRGTTSYNSTDSETIKGAYTLANTKTKITYGTSDTPSGGTYQVGDVYIKETLVSL